MLCRGASLPGCVQPAVALSRCLRARLPGGTRVNVTSKTNGMRRLLLVYGDPEPAAPLLWEV